MNSYIEWQKKNDKVVKASTHRNAVAYKDDKKLEWISQCRKTSDGSYICKQYHYDENGVVITRVPDSKWQIYDKEGNPTVWSGILTKDIYGCEVRFEEYARIKGRN